MKLTTGTTPLTRISVKNSRGMRFCGLGAFVGAGRTTRAGMDGDTIDDPDSVFDGMRRRNGWVMSGLPWSYDPDPERWRFPSASPANCIPVTTRTNPGR
jgi:hypothetical protein